MNDKIIDWINRNTVGENSWKKFDDFHVNGLREVWLQLALKYFRSVNDYLKEKSLPYYAELNVKLKYSKEKTGMNFNSIGEIESQFTSTPPSLYIFPNNYEKLELNKSKSTPLPEIIFLEGKAFYSEIYDESEKEYFRGIFIVPK